MPLKIDNLHNYDDLFAHLDFHFGCVSDIWIAKDIFVDFINNKGWEIKNIDDLSTFDCRKYINATLRLNYEKDTCEIKIVILKEQAELNF